MKQETQQETQPELAAHPMRVRSNDKESTGSYQIVHYSDRDAIHSGIKTSLLMLGAAIASILLPGIHFVSVPMGILAAPFVGVYFYRARKGKPRRMRADIECPECHAKNHVATSYIAPHYECKCAHCQHDLHLTPL